MTVAVAPGTIVVFSDIWCSFAHLAVHRLHATRARLGLEGVVAFDHHAFPLELLNGHSSPRPGTDSEVSAIGRLDPEAGWKLWQAPDWSYPTTTLPALEAVQAAKEQGLAVSEALDLALRKAFWLDSRCISLRSVLLDVAAETTVVDVDHLAAALDDGRARKLVMADFVISQTDTVQCSPHLFLADGTNQANPGVEVHYTGDYGTGFPIATADDPSVYETLLLRAAGSLQAV
ncbi:DsbA family oxidoreductase [Kribbella sp. CA-294648]|uniref:DsbA family oxidoreductase n=1 Tax=Kribbella sp. CA-294648 TaxID=3239948 RepID=UPI003D92C2E4